MSDDHASILFPNDAPKQTPDWFVRDREAAELRLSRRADDEAASMFPGERKPEAARPSAGSDASPEEALFANDAAKYDDSAAREFFDTFATNATLDGDHERAEALQEAGAALIADARSAGTNPAELGEALNILRERQGDCVAGPVSDEKLAEDFQSAMSNLMAEGVSMSDIDAARSMIDDMERISPGTKATLSETGAGNDPRLIALCIKEARRRGY